MKYACLCFKQWKLVGKRHGYSLKGNLTVNCVGEKLCTICWIWNLLDIVFWAMPQSVMPQQVFFNSYQREITCCDVANWIVTSCAGCKFSLEERNTSTFGAIIESVLNYPLRLLYFSLISSMVCTLFWLCLLIVGFLSLTLSIHLST